MYTIIIIHNNSNSQWESSPAVKINSCALIKSSNSFKMASPGITRQRPTLASGGQPAGSSVTLSSLLSIPGYSCCWGCLQIPDDN